jgi:hypothetical protein
MLLVAETPSFGHVAVQAVYDAQRGEFVITTPNNEASKYWIGGSGQHGKVSVAVVRSNQRSSQVYTANSTSARGAVHVVFM